MTTNNANEPQAASLPTTDATSTSPAKKVSNADMLTKLNESVSTLLKSQEDVGHAIELLTGNSAEVAKLNESVSSLTAQVSALTKNQQELSDRLGAHVSMLAPHVNAIELLAGKNSADLARLTKNQEELSGRLTDIEHTIEALTSTQDLLQKHIEKAAKRSKKDTRKQERCPHCFGEKTVTVGGETKTCPECKGTGEPGKLHRMTSAIGCFVSHPITQAVFRGVSLFAGGMAANEGVRRLRSRYGSTGASVVEINSNAA